MVEAAPRARVEGGERLELAGVEAPAHPAVEHQLEPGCAHPGFRARELRLRRRVLLEDPGQPALVERVPGQLGEIVEDERLGQGLPLLGRGGDQVARGIDLAPMWPTHQTASMR
ncbi:hypothetical protein ACMHYB_38625 [Sorangium sp. So ce1128]